MKSTQKIADALLILEYQSGNKKALSILVKKWHAKFCKQAFWYTKNIETAKDVAQESWSAILFKLRDLKDPNCFGSWALTIVNRKAIDWLRKNKNIKDEIDENLENTADELKEEVDHKAFKIKSLINAIKQLPYNQQMVLNLFYMEEYSLKEVSKILGISTGTVKSRLFHAREKLKTMIKKQNY